MMKQHWDKGNRKFSVRWISLLVFTLIFSFTDTKPIAAMLAVVEDPAKVLPDVGRDSSIQAPDQYFDFRIGDRHLRHDQVTSYFQYLGQTSSGRVQWIQYGETSGKRPLYVLAITAPENHEVLKRILARRQRMTNGSRRSELDLDNEKLVVWMGYCVHGDEASAVNAAPLVAYHLASAQSDEVTTALHQCVFLIDPAMNPDGVDRFANWSNENRGRFASDSSVDREHIQPWPGGRGNYYWFDLNRDWLPVSQPESQGRLKLFHQWKPNVVLDYHEMGGESTYFFQPGIPTRNNPLTPAENVRLTQVFADNFADTMDQAKELYFTRESFDDFYIGKGSTYPDLNGAVGILFEQGSTRGLRLKNTNTDRHFRDTVANQVRTSLTAVRTAIEHKQALLKFQSSFYQEALQQGQSDPTKAYLLFGSPSRVRAAQRLLRAHAIRSHLNVAEVYVDEKRFQPGELLIIPTAQPQYTMLRSLLDTPQEFEENIFYDVSAWHLPSALDLSTLTWQADIPPQWLERNDDPTPTGLDWSDSASWMAVAFSPVELESATWVTRLQRRDAQVCVSLVPFATGDDPNTDLPAGTYVVIRAHNERRWNAIVKSLQQWSRTSSINVVPVTTGINPDGPDLGSGRLRRIPECRPALVVGPGTTATVAGAVWHYLDHRLEQPAVLLDAERVARADLNQFSCLILPSGNYGSWGNREAEVLNAYAKQGGTIIGIGSAVSWLQRNGVASENQTSKVEATSNVGADTGEKGANPSFGEASDLAALERIAGAFFMSKIDATHPLGFGFPDQEVPVFRDSATAFGTPTNPYQSAAKYEAVIAGYVSAKNREKLNGTVAVWAQNNGSGRVILIADNPVFRGYVRSSERFLSNAILLGPVLYVPSAPARD